MNSQDIVIAIKLLILNGKKLTFAELGKQVKLSASEVHAATNRLKESYLLDTFSGNIRKASFEDIK